MNESKIAIITNRMQTLIDLYTRDTTIDMLVEMTGLKYDQIRKVLNDNNIHHGIKRQTGDPNYPSKPVLFYEDYEYLLECPKLDALRVF